MPIPWKDLRRAFNFDGSLRDIVVVEADRQLWQQAIDYVRQLDRAGSVHLDESAPSLPDDVGEIFLLSARGEARLSIDLGKIRVNCFFFVDDEIEFDLDPLYVTSQEDAASVLSFMRGLREAAGREVHLTEENAHEWRWLTFDPATSGWSFEPATDNSGDKRASVICPWLTSLNLRSKRADNSTEFAPPPTLGSTAHRWEWSEVSCSIH